MQQSASPEQLKQRRRQLQQQRLVRTVKSLWRFSCMSGILAGVVWAIDRSDWHISQPERVRIEGNRYLTDETIRSILAIAYPQMIMEIAPAQLTAKLLDRASIASVKIDRFLYPPRLVIKVQDLPPVAQIMVDENAPPQKFVDERGLQMPIASYHTAVAQSPPSLRLRPPELGTCPAWAQIYQAVRTSPVAVGIVDCRNPQNLIFHTNVVEVRLGAFRDESRLKSQLQQIDRLRNWRTSTSHPETVDYLDLEHLDRPFFKIRSPQTPPQSP